MSAMRRVALWGGVLWWGCALPWLSGCSNDAAPTGVYHAPFTLLTYNVAGLPQGISGSDPEHNIPLISPLLNDYDVVLVQEDFVYHEQLVTDVDFMHQTAPSSSQGSIGDGLNIFSSEWPLDAVTRIPWDDCYGRFDSGSDCLTPKGFARAQLQIAPDTRIDVYNLHADAGRSAPDVEARAGNLAQLQEVIETYSAGQAVIVAGDFNERYSYADEHVRAFVEALGLQDAWVEVARDGEFPPSPSEQPAECATDEGDPNCERIDKILYRGSARIQLAVEGYEVPVAEFVDEDGLPLSDHPPVAARFTCSVEL
jgi:endonuclease/exonuclease/phosphatase family metal-dependent hydrolase